jgi:hypothetical protein
MLSLYYNAPPYLLALYSSKEGRCSIIPSIPSILSISYLMLAIIMSMSIAMKEQ